MRWPWVSRTAYELLLEERDRLREQNDHLLANVTRVQRARVGLPEVPRERKPREEEPIPDNIAAIIQGFSMEPIRAELRRQVAQMREQGTPYAEIEKVLKAKLLH